MDTKYRERATKKEWEEKLESFAAGSFQLSRGQWPPKGSGSCGQPMNKGNWHTYTSPLLHVYHTLFPATGHRHRSRGTCTVPASSASHKRSG